MYQSIPSLTIPPGKPKANFPQRKKVRNSDPWGRKIAPKTPPLGQLLSKIQQKDTKHEIEIMKNSTEMLICLEILKQ